MTSHSKKKWYDPRTWFLEIEEVEDDSTMRVISSTGDIWIKNPELQPLHGSTSDFSDTKTEEIKKEQIRLLAEKLYVDNRSSISALRNATEFYEYYYGEHK